MTLEKLSRLAAEGRGQGHGAAYKPLLPLTRKTLSPKSFNGFKLLPMLGRHGHFRSLNEWYVALFVLWLQVGDLREQYPLWPWRHPHPLYGRLDYQPVEVPYSRGLVQIAKTLGIKHGVSVGTCLPYVASEDLMVTLTDRSPPRGVMISCKPGNMFDEEGLTPRNVERLHLARAYAEDLAMPWWLASAADIPATLCAQLDGLERKAVPYSDRMAALVEPFAEHLEEKIATGRELEYCRASLIARLKIEPAEYDWLFDNAIWHRRISLDPRVPWYMGRPAVRTDFAWVDAPRRYLFGGAQ